MNSPCCFIDSSAFIALNHAGDQNHTAAFEIASKLNHYKFLVSDSVITETYSILRYRLGYRYAERFLQLVLDSDEYEILEVTPSIRTETLNVLRKFGDQPISYCDALSALLMRYNKVEAIFAFDPHFDVLGVKLINHWDIL